MFNILPFNNQILSSQDNNNELNNKHLDNGFSVLLENLSAKNDSKQNTENTAVHTLNQSYVLEEIEKDQNVISGHESSAIQIINKTDTNIIPQNDISFAQVTKQDVAFSTVTNNQPQLSKEEQDKIASLTKKGAEFSGSNKNLLSVEQKGINTAQVTKQDVAFSTVTNNQPQLSKEEQDKIASLTKKGAEFSGSNKNLLSVEQKGINTAQVTKQDVAFSTVTNNQPQLSKEEQDKIASLTKKGAEFSGSNKNLLSVEQKGINTAQVTKQDVAFSTVTNNQTQLPLIQRSVASNEVIAKYQQSHSNKIKTDKHITAKKISNNSVEYSPMISFQQSVKVAGNQVTLANNNSNNDKNNLDSKKEYGRTKQNTENTIPAQDLAWKTNDASINLIEKIRSKLQNAVHQNDHDYRFNINKSVESEKIKLNVNLSKDNIGNLNLELTKDQEGQFVLNILAEDSKAVDILKGNLIKLEDSLKTMGLEIKNENITFELKSNNDNNSSNQGFQDRQQQSDSQSKRVINIKEKIVHALTRDASDIQSTIGNINILV